MSDDIRREEADRYRWEGRVEETMRHLRADMDRLLAGQDLMQRDLASMVGRDRARDDAREEAERRPPVQPPSLPSVSQGQTVQTLAQALLVTVMVMAALMGGQATGLIKLVGG